LLRKQRKTLGVNFFLPHPVGLMLKISYEGCSGLSLVISVQFALKMCLAAQNRQK